MRAMIVTSADGLKRRLSPMALLGWRTGDITRSDGALVEGTILALVDGAMVGVRETQDTIDWMFEVATAPVSPPNRRIGSPVLIDETGDEET